MQVTKEILSGKLLQYLNRRITAADLAVWAEDIYSRTDGEPLTQEA